MIHTEDLTKHFDDFVAVNGVNLDVAAGQVLALLGPNGAGKTTTVRMLTSILVPTRGKAEIAGFDVVRQPARVRASVGVLTEHHGLYARMNAEEYLQFFGGLYGLDPGFVGKHIGTLLDQFGLGEARRQKLGEYSKGMRQKLALVRALLHDPPVLLLDEPTSAMDPESARIVRDAIRELRSEHRAIILCTHNLNEAEKLADQIAIIRRGEIILSGSPEEIKRRLLGPEEFEIRFVDGARGWPGELPPGVSVTGSGPHWLRISVEDPTRTNPLLVRAIVAADLDVISFGAVPRSLEDAYLQAVSHQEEVENGV